mmetsp:Transcript_95867/g.169416  ORF Transcript_95867/g.169416 Transcript_95867/m.169416 type:complete len:192 (-) Transcript_95867:58-633(-)
MQQHVLHRMQDAEGSISEVADVPVAEQQLLMRHMELSDASCLADLSAASTPLSASNGGADDMVELRIISMCGDHICTLKVERSRAIKDVKRSISEVTDVSEPEQKLLMGHSELSEADCFTDVCADRTVELTLVRQQRAVNGILSSFLCRTLEESPKHAPVEWHQPGNWSIKDVLGTCPQAEAAAAVGDGSW